MIRTLAVLGLLCAAAAAQDLVVYSGRSQNLVEPLVEKARKDTGLDIAVRYASTAQLALTIQEEGSRSPADLFWAQDAGALGALSAAGLLRELPDDVLGRVPEEFRGAQGTWVGTSGRARVLAYSTKRVAEGELPASVFDLTDPKWKGRVGWAPTNASFQAFVTAMRVRHGDERTRAWLAGMRRNGVKDYAKNTPILEAIAAGEVDLGLPNHYYLHRFLAEYPHFPVAQRFFAEGDVGNLVNVAGAGVLKGAKHGDAALRFLRYLLSEEAQRHVAREVSEYPLVEGVEGPPGLGSLGALREKATRIDLDQLRDLRETLAILREVGLL